MKHLEEQIARGNKALYLSPDEWSIFEQTLPKEMLTMYALVGYSRSFEPVKQREEICLAYKMLPVFRVPIPGFIGI